MSTTADERWAPYLAWNGALADVVYPPEMAGVPVYLDPEPEVLRDAAARADAIDADPKDALVGAVRATLNPPSHSAGVFGGHIARLIRWRPGTDEPPPVVGLLTVLAIAAEDMRESGGFAANNYYDRLMPLLGVTTDEDKKRVIVAYRRRSFDLWESLNSWLEALRGERGLPTAYSYAHEHIGRPLSQALIRAADRSKLEEFFLETGFEQRMRVAPEDLEPLLNAWISRNPSPASQQIQALWKRSGARERILEIASQLLETWEPPTSTSRRGSGADRPAQRRSAIRLFALLRTFPTTVLELSLVGPDLDGGDHAHLMDSNGGHDLGIDVGIERLPDGRWRLADPEEFESSALVEGAIRLSFGSAATIERRPRRVVPLKKDDLLQAFVEVERLGLGEDGMVLCTSGLAAVVQDALEQIARPGFRRIDPPPRGCPHDWTLFTHIQVLAPLMAATSTSGKDWPLDLNVLQPLSSSQLVIQGGLQLPGRIRRWSSAAPPEIRVSADDADGVRVTVARVGTFQDTITVSVKEGPERVLLVDLREEHLDDGDYEVTAATVSGTKSRTLNSSRLRLRSADSAKPPADGRGLACPLANGDLVTVSAGPWDGSSPAVRGRSVLGSPTPVALRASEVGVPRWWIRRQDPTLRRQADEGERARVKVARAVGTACFQTGAHVLQLPTYYGRSTAKSIEGVCKYCGLVRRFPGSYYRIRKGSPKKRVNREAPVFDVGRTSAVLADVEITPDVALDALSHDGVGPASWIEQVALQVEPSQLFVDRFIRALDVLGHVEVERDTKTLGVTSWEVLPPSLVETQASRYVLSGFRSRRLVEALDAEVGSRGIALERSAQRPFGPDRIALSATAEDVNVIVGRARERAEMEIGVTDCAARRLAAVLPCLQQVIDSVPRQPMVGGRMFRRWSTVVARWAAVGDASAPGAYQVLAPSPLYCVRDDHDIANGTMRRVDVRLGKYVAALEAGESLIGYDAKTETLYVPLGADLPGLYGRSAVACSGRLPFEDEAQRLTRYESVPQDIAEHIISLLQPEEP